MGILNVTLDSFSDGGLWVNRDLALRHAMEMAQAGADIIDVGGESTRPGSLAVNVQQELDRVIPLIEFIVAETGLPVSIDTSKPEVMEAAVSAGAGMINDVYGLRQEAALETAATLDVPVCLVHMQGRPGDMQQNPEFTDVVGEVSNFLLARAGCCELAGIPRQNIIIDPGFGFGKTLQHNIDLFKAIPAFVATGYPVLVGISRKSMLGQLSDKAVDQRLAASLSAAVLAAQAGAAIIRVHDVDETVDALKIASALRSG
ncbi:MAG: dihydropteroate synthase [Xanthomonadales bacterium]